MAYATGLINLPNAASDLATSGNGSILMTTATNMMFASGSTLTTVDGPIELNANQQSPATAGNFVGININGAQIQSTGSSATSTVTVNGRGGNGPSANYGVFLHGGGVISGGSFLSPAINATDVTGTGGSGPGGVGSNFQHGVFVEGAGSSATITSAGGNVRVRGFGGASASDNYGVVPDPWRHDHLRG